MRIERLQCKKTVFGTQWQADVIWESCKLAPQVLELASHGLSPDHPPAEFFALNMLPNALARRERRVVVDAALHPELFTGLPVAMGALSAWFCRGRKVPELSGNGGKFFQAANGRGCGLFLSGGADSLALLIYLSRHYPPGHPMRPTHAYFVNGMDIGSNGDTDLHAAFYERARQSMEPVCASVDVKLIPVHTNLRQHGLARSSWPRMHFGMAMAGLAHAFSHEVAYMHIASGFSAKQDVPKLGSYPCIEPFCSTSQMQIHLGMQHLTRVERVALLAEQEEALKCLRVCWQHIENDGPLNCSRCHKCLLTMMALIACDGLEKCPTFSASDVTPAMARSTLLTHQYSSYQLYAELLEPLAKAGRLDLVEVLQEKMRQTRRRLSALGRIRARIQKSLKKAFGR